MRGKMGSKAALITAGGAAVSVAGAMAGLARRRHQPPAPAAILDSAIGNRRIPVEDLLPTRVDDLIGSITAPDRGRTVRTGDGAELFVREFGPADGEPIVMCHGWVCCTEFWAPQINALADRYRVITYDQRGHGNSTMGSARLTAGTPGADLADVLQATVDPAKPAVIVGHSMGGMSIMSWAGRRPDEVSRYAKGIVLASTGANQLLQDLGVLPFRRRLPARAEALLRASIGTELPLPAETLTSPLVLSGIRYVALSKDATRAEVDFSARIVRSCSPKTRGAWGLMLADLDIYSGLENITVPTTVLVGADDRLTPAVHSYRIAAKLADTGELYRFIEIPGVGHMLPVEAVEQTNAEIIRLAQHTDEPAIGRPGGVLVDA
ncbi:alpha/beta fold hydrolase [Millisia brevis]|uniref:alpha/beta fold hydrolase n=1 Tax=Millisia brevis TaxID=264148 RepID=UPI001FDF100F|nr:alpha/beta hydrolase [Millisia brevis]